MGGFVPYGRWLEEAFVGHARGGYPHGKHPHVVFEVHRNPEPSECPDEIRAIGDDEGNLWIALSDEDWATHDVIVGLVNRLNTRDHVSLPYKYSENEYRRGETIALQRYGNTDVMALGESYEDEKLNEETWKRLKEKRKGWRFIAKKVGDVYEQDVRDLK